MPKKVITRRQRKAAEFRLKANEEANENAPRIKGDTPISLIPRSTNLPNVKVAYPKKKDKCISLTTLDVRDEKPKTPSSEQPFGKSKESIKRCDALQKIRLTSHKKTFLSEVKKKALNSEQFGNTSSSEFTTLLPRINNKATHKTQNSRVPLMSKICEQIKTHLHSVLPSRNLGSKPRIPAEKVAEHSPDLQFTRKVFNSSEDIFKTGGDYDRKVSCFKSAELPKDPGPPMKVFGNAGFIVLTGTNAQLAFQLGELANRGVGVQSCIRLPNEMMDKVEQQLGKLEKEREKILNKMHNKHATLAQGLAQREKKTIRDGDVRTKA
ncbi:uncharacterized protein LOC6535293 [Drosophila yakuba]|uniref:Uncharacterized protein n=1 Tax=Drosophila yakuba TaxID=7245 RepID=B4PTS8_DROYA|nr:uncharacterized protein LOC6535293 [Drosophila yakuba]EDW95661.1 uncharacterized protein Dyak_GE18066 [Drosophila yakuba]